jgi:hypothetical protein
MQVGAGDMVRLDIPADIVTEVAKVLVVVPMAHTLRVLNAPSNMWSQARTPGLLAKMTVIFAHWW